MNRLTQLTFLATLTAWLSTQALDAQSNAPASLILPPKDWNHREHILYALTVTNKPGEYLLPSSWVGVEKVTACTGWYAAKDWDTEDKQPKLVQIKRITVSSGRLLPAFPEDRYVWDGPKKPFPMFSFRSSLPTDAVLLKIHDAESIRQFWRSEHVPFKNSETNMASIGVNYFTLGPYNSIDTLSVLFMHMPGSSSITNMLVRRSHCTRQ